VLHWFVPQYPLLLDPRYYRIDDILRGPYTPTTPFGSSGEHLWAASPQGWGFRGGVRWRHSTEPYWLAPFTLTIRGDGQPIEPGDAISRPSHVTLHAVGQESGLQVTEDKFVTDDDVVVSILSLRNPGDGDIDVRMDVAWGVASGRNDFGYAAPVYVHRAGPPGDDLRLRLPSQSHRTLVFAAAFALDSEEAARRSARWGRNPSVLRLHVAEFQAWFDENAPRFDCSDPWLTKLWYHGWQQERRGRPARRAGIGSLLFPKDDWAAVNTLVREQFEEGDYVRPRASAERPEPGSLWPHLILHNLIGLTPRNDDLLEVQPMPTRAGDSGWSHFCAEGVPYQGRRLTLVWDDPADPEDAFHDGDKGFTVYVDGVRLFHDDRLIPFQHPLPAV